MADLAVTFATHTEMAPNLEVITAHAVRLIDAVDFADILLVDEDGHRSLAQTAPVTAELDTVQVELGEGPCLEAIAKQPLVHSVDLTREQRWPNFAAAALATGIRSMMSFHLYLDPSETRSGRRHHGALNLFSRKSSSFSPSDQAVGAMLATHAATAIISTARQAQFDAALNSRDAIGQAKGVLMERFHVNAVRAFYLMKKLSQDTNTPVRVIAQRIIDSM